MKTSADYTLNFKEYGEITVPKGTKVSHNTAMGVDKNYHFVDEYEWIYENYPTYANILKDDVFTYGINVPKEFIDYEKPKKTQKNPSKPKKPNGFFCNKSVNQRESKCLNQCENCKEF